VIVRRVGEAAAPTALALVRGGRREAAAARARGAVAGTR